MHISLYAFSDGAGLFPLPRTPPAAPAPPGPGYHTLRSVGGHIHGARVRLINECRATNINSIFTINRYIFRQIKQNETFVLFCKIENVVISAVFQD